MKHIALALAATALIGAAPNWSTTVTKSAMNAYVLGNPAAKVKLVEYISYTCGHCAHFNAEGGSALKRAYIPTGKVSVEFRNAVRDQFDLTAALAARCGGPAKFHGNTDVIMAAQSVWMGKAQAWANENASKMQSMPINTVLLTLSKALGFEAMLAKRGVAPKQLAACMVDQNAQKQVVAMAKDAFEVQQISGTPSFTINGRMLDHVHDWSNLEPALKAAVAAN
jgi:protein-disulfide isomerase